MKLIVFRVLVVLFMFPVICFSLNKKRLVLGFGGGYSFSLDATLDNRIYNFPNRQIIFEEEGKLKHSFSLNVQYHFSQMIGLQLEYSQQKASYFSHLKWYGLWLGRGNDINNPGDYTPINHFEEPYRESWGINAFTLSLLFNYPQSYRQKIIPYISAGIGYHFLTGDQELVLDRFRLAPKKSGGSVKIGLGFKYWFSSKIGLNLMLFVHGLRRPNRFTGLHSNDVLYIGPRQFDLDAYFEQNRILRIPDVWESSFSYIGLSFGLEFAPFR